jgi:hypothetical protein
MTELTPPTFDPADAAAAAARALRDTLNRAR